LKEEIKKEDEASGKDAVIVDILTTAFSFGFFFFLGPRGPKKPEKSCCNVDSRRKDVLSFLLMALKNLAFFSFDWRFMV
jgi:hypothetical protein